MSEHSAEKSTGTKTVSLFVPGLQLHDVGQIRKMIDRRQSFDSLDLLYSRSNYQRGNQKSPEHALFELFNVLQPESLDLPIGALTRFLAMGSESGNLWAMRADPVLIQPNRDHLVLLGNSGLDISFTEAEKIVNDINQTYDDTSWILRAITPKQWVIEQQQPEQIETESLSVVVGKNINDYMPKGNNEKKWHALLNELQMFLHAHPVNQQRQQQGLPVVNSLWFWGGGILPTLPDNVKQKPFAQCWSNETTSLALARLGNVPRIDLPTDGAAWLMQAVTPGHHLLVIELLSNDLVRNDPLEWWQSLIAVDQQWLTPLVNAVKQNAIEQLHVYDADGSSFQLTRRLARRWWKLGSRK